MSLEKCTVSGNIQKLEVGAVLWHMEGRRRHGKIYWAAVPKCIQISNERGFLFDQSMVDAKHGQIWGNIGKNYFTSRDECLTNWGDKPYVEDDIRPVIEQEDPDPKEYSKQVIWLGNPTSTVNIHIGCSREMFPTSNLVWNVDSDLAESMGDDEGGYCLTLDEIARQIIESYGNTIIEVRVESPLDGVIHQTGNCSNLWHRQGATIGYA